MQGPAPQNSYAPMGVALQTNPNQPDGGNPLDNSQLGQINPSGQPKGLPQAARANSYYPNDAYNPHNQSKV